MLPQSFGIMKSSGEDEDSVVDEIYSEGISMTSLAELYQQEIHDEIGLFPTWLPGDHIKLGDVGILSGGRFKTLSSIATLATDWGDGIEINEEKAGTAERFTYQSNCVIDIKASGSAETTIGSTTIGKCELKLAFSKNGAFIFDSVGAQHYRIQNQLALNDWILAQYAKKKWKKEWHVIDELYSAVRTVVIVCQSNLASLILKGNIPLLTPNGKLSLADVSTEFSIIPQNGDVLYHVGNSTQPLYSCSKIISSIWNGATVKPQFMNPLSSIADADAENEVVRMEIDELLES